MPFLVDPMRKRVADGCMRVRRAQDPPMSHAMAQNAYSLLRRLALAAARMNATWALRAAGSTAVACCGRSEGPTLSLYLPVKWG